jgi:phosphotransferase system  glucose/maltose/N-acetylglucosamine-specific IIC component
MPTLYFTAFQRDSVIASILLLLVIVSAIHARWPGIPTGTSKPQQIASRYWNLVGFGVMFLGFLWRIVFRDR